MSEQMRIYTSPIDLIANKLGSKINKYIIHLSDLFEVIQKNRHARLATVSAVSGNSHLSLSISVPNPHEWVKQMEINILNYSLRTRFIKHGKLVQRPQPHKSADGSGKFCS